MPTGSEPVTSASTTRELPAVTIIFVLLLKGNFFLEVVMCSVKRSM